MGPSKTLLADIKKTCPPDVYAMIEREGSFMHAAKAAHMGANTVAALARGTQEITPQLRKRIDAYHATLAGGAQPRETASPFAPKSESVIPAWNKKTTTAKIHQNNGKTKTLKNIPTDFLELVKRNDGVYNRAAVAIGYSGWNPIRNMIEKKKYEEKIHPLVFRALNGLPVNRKGQDDSGAGDNFTLGLAICLVSLTEYERIEDVAEILDGHIVFKMSAGSTGWIVIYRFRGRDKMETFKRLASRDAKKIVCP